MNREFGIFVFVFAFVFGFVCFFRKSLPDTWPFWADPSTQHSTVCHPSVIPVVRSFGMCLAGPLVHSYVFVWHPVHRLYRWPIWASVVVAVSLWSFVLWPMRLVWQLIGRWQRQWPHSPIQQMMPVTQQRQSIVCQHFPLECRPIWLELYLDWVHSNWPPAVGFAQLTRWTTPMPSYSAQLYFRPSRQYVVDNNNSNSSNKIW